MKNFPRPSEAYKDAESRVDGSELLSRYKKIFLDDWPEGEEHLKWVAEADESELLSWARCIARNL